MSFTIVSLHVILFSSSPLVFSAVDKAKKHISLGTIRILLLILDIWSDPDHPSTVLWSFFACRGYALRWIFF